MKKIKKNTIFALSTPIGTSAIAVTRVSGPECRRIASKLCGKSNLSSRHAYFTVIKDFDGNMIDTGVLIYFKSPSSFTGEDCLEIHTHGSMIVIDTLLSTLSKFKFTRSAMPGEFSKRGYQNKKQNLLYYEGVHSLIKSETENQMKIANRQTFGETQNICKNWRKSIIKNLSILDASIEFTEEDEFIDCQKARKSLSNLLGEVEKFLETSQNARKLHNGQSILIFGPPNAGKSSFFNFLCQEDKVIVSRRKGTTTDQVSSSINISGSKINLIDSAGLRQPKEFIEQKGVSKTIDSILKLEKFILVLSPDTLVKSNVSFIGPIVRDLNEKKLFVIYNKTDIKGSTKKSLEWQKSIPELKKFDSLSISCVKPNKNINILRNVLDILHKNFIRLDNKHLDDYLFSESRHIECINNIKNHLHSSLKHFLNIEIAANFLKAALNEVDLLYGNHTSDEELDHIFTNFCIGK